MGIYKKKVYILTYLHLFQYFGNSSELNKAEKSALRGFVGAAVQNIVPRSMREDFLKNYTCKPPPVFMIIISIIEVK